VAVSGAERALAVHDALRSYLPEIVALSANAPYHRGGDSGLATVRPKVNTCWPRFGIPPAFSSWSELVALDRWARESGAYADESYQWWDLRLRSELGTLEVRAADVPTSVEETATITAFVQSLVYDLACRYDAGEGLAVHAHERISENLWLATRDGLAGRLIDLDSGRNSWTSDRLLRLAENLLPAATALGCDSELRDIARIVRDGGGAGRQRQLVETAGPAGLIWSLAEETQAGRFGRSGTTADLLSP
jgi:carboxylate-amine ligase